MNGCNSEQELNEPFDMLSEATHTVIGCDEHRDVSMKAKTDQYYEFLAVDRPRDERQPRYSGQVRTQRRSTQ